MRTPSHVQEIQRIKDYPSQKTATFEQDVVIANPDKDTQTELARLAIAIHPSYQLTFGEKWGEGAINKENSNQVISIEEYLSLNEEQRRKYKLFYPLPDFINRFIKEQTPREGMKSFTAVSMNPEGEIIAAAWAIQDNIASIIERIGEANYKFSKKTSRIWDVVSTKLKEDIERLYPENSQKLIYWDEIFTIPQLEGQGIGEKLMSKMLKAFIDAADQDEGVLILFRTSKDSAMAKMSNLFSKIKLGSLLEYDEDVENIIYTVGKLSPGFVRIASMIGSNEIFKSLLRYQKRKIEE